MANTNKFLGLFRGPIDHQSSSVINVLSNGTIIMGEVVELKTLSGGILPTVGPNGSLGATKAYGIAVGGDNDGVYGDGSTGDETNLATTGADQGVVIVTQGRCLARVGGAVGGAVAIGDDLTMSAVSGVLQKVSAANQSIIAKALNTVLALDTDMIAVDVQRGVAHA